MVPETSPIGVVGLTAEISSVVMPFAVKKFSLFICAVFVFVVLSLLYIFSIRLG